MTFIVDDHILKDEKELYYTSGVVRHHQIKNHLEHPHEASPPPKKKKIEWYRFNVTLCDILVIYTFYDNK